MRKITIEAKETKHAKSELYVNVYNNGLIEFRYNIKQALGNESDVPESRITKEQLKTLINNL